ncbi:hypothetical protein [Leifsonia sp. NPDC077715]|uniref:hypothetical protein n=1 Tax=Leifsonia sp. NPDC077715 TaxID=3155539 RepID=UPI003428BE07
MDHIGTTTRGPGWRRLSLWLAIGVLVAAALLGSVFIILGDQAEIAGRAWLTLLIAAAFAGTVVLDAGLANGPHRWYLPVSTGVDAVLVLVGLLKTWGGLLQPEDAASGVVWSMQFFRFFWIVVLVRAALLVTQTYGLRFVARATSQATKLFAALAVAFVWAIAVLLALPPTLPELEWPDVWWRLVGAATLVTAVLFLIPIIVFAFEPKPPSPSVTLATGTPVVPELFVAEPPSAPEEPGWTPPMAEGLSPAAPGVESAAGPQT